MVTKTREQRNREKAFLLHHQIRATCIRRVHAGAFIEKWYSMKRDMSYQFEYSPDATFSCEVKIWYIDDDDRDMHEWYIGHSWLDIMQQIDRRNYLLPVEDYDDIPF